MTIINVLFWAIVLLTIPLIVLGWVAASDTERARELRRLGWSQQKIATALGVTRHRVRKMLAA
jgi:ABC-type microcin C transport system permease subunit YejE